jgi:hypothetical protein
VEVSSAQRLAQCNFYKVEDANHMEVCKPPSKEHPSYQMLLQLIRTCLQVINGLHSVLSLITYVKWKHYLYELAEINFLEVYLPKFGSTKVAFYDLERN